MAPKHTYKTCKIHGETKHILTKNGRGDSHYRCPLCIKASYTKYNVKLKAEFLNYLGNKCTVCGYDKCIAALEFHHRDKTKKNFNIGSVKASLTGKHREKMLKELDKCDVLCANCHRELHYEED